MFGKMQDHKIHSRTEIIDTDLLLLNVSVIRKVNRLNFDFYSTFGKHPPLGLAYLASYCKLHDYGVELLDLDVEHLSETNLEKKIAKLKPNLIRIPCSSRVFTFP